MKSTLNLSIIFILILIIITNLFAQAPDTLWTRSYGGSNYDCGYSVYQTLDGGFIIVGFTESFGAGMEDIWLIRTDVNGDTPWTITFGGINADYVEIILLL